MAYDVTERCGIRFLRLIRQETKYKWNVGSVPETLYDKNLSEQFGRTFERTVYKNCIARTEELQILRRREDDNIILTVVD